MLYFPLILAAGSLPTLISGAPVRNSISDIVAKAASTHSLSERGSSYTTYGGNGQPSEGWPRMSDWVSDFDTMFNANKGVMQSSCTQWGVPNNSDNEISDISTAIQSVGKSTNIDPRFILAIVLQESNGCVRAPTTNYGVRNPGLTQSHDGTGTCNDGTVSNPCPQSQITQMIQDGAGGTSSGDGLKQCLSESGANDVSQYYKAARIYNSGSIAAGGNLGAGIATHCYVSDIANRLTGWSSGPSTCDPATVGTLTGTAGGSSSGSSSGSSNAQSASPSAAISASPAPSASIPGGIFATVPISSAPVATTAPVVSSSAPAPAVTATVIPVAVTSTAAPAATSAPAASSNSGAPKYYGAVTSCQEWYTVSPGDYCQLVTDKFGISQAQLMSWNSGLDEACSNLWLGYQYCVKG